jgi:hypothetical protein
MPLKRGLFTAWFRRTLANFYTGPFLPLKFFFMRIFFDWKKRFCPFKSHLWIVFLDYLNLPFLFHIVDARSFHTRSSTNVHTWSSRWVAWCFLLNLISPAVQKPGAGLFLTLFWPLCKDSSYWLVTLFRLLLLAGSAIYVFCVTELEAFLACLVCLGGFLPLLIAFSG